ncbi:unnamed protein product [Rotaria sp. Silwood1]|nr:unnamed protein product [Rotaria sp. Silwood1]
MMHQAAVVPIMEQKLLKAQLKDDYDYLEVFKLWRSSVCSMDSDEIKSKAFPFVYDTKGQTDTETRRDSLKASLQKIFPNHGMNVFIFSKSWYYRTYTKGSASFEKEYGTDVLVVLS